MSDRRVVYFARHGETDWNAVGRWQGQTDIPLNDVGRAQARALGVWLQAQAGERIRSVGASDLARARETADIVAQVLGLPVGHTDHAFRERAYGIFEGLTAAECVARYPAEWTRFQDDPRDPPAGVEPLDAVAGRMLIGLRRATETMETPALLVSHGRAIRTLVSLVLREPVAAIANGGVYRVVVVDGEPVEAALLPLA